MVEREQFPEQDSMLTNSQREFLIKSEKELEAMNDNTVYKKQSRINKRVRAGMWDFGLLMAEMEPSKIEKLYDGPEMKPRYEQNFKRTPVEGFSDHAANVIGFLYLALPFPAFQRAISLGVFRAEEHGRNRRMITVDVDVERTFAPTKENEHAYNKDELMQKLRSSERLSEMERSALLNIVEHTDRETVEKQDQLFSEE